jgi:membrane-anchored protein YejM (alkaline phosphatase superfamily)
MMLTETPRRKRVTRLVSWGHWFALLNIFIAVVIAGIYVLNSPAPDSLLGGIYLGINWLSHIGFLTFFAFVILILPLCYLLPNERLVRGIGSGVGALGLALLGFDALMYNKYGVHLTLNSAELIRYEAETVVAQFGWQQWGFLIFLFSAWLLFQLIVANALWQRIERLQKLRLGLPISGFFVACFVLSHAMHVWADARLYQPIVQQDNMFPLSYPATAKTLMARYSLLDIEDYEQRKSLQFNSKVQGMAYPSAPIYCALDKQQKVLILVSSEALAAEQIQGFYSANQHYAFHSDSFSETSSLVYGLPALYHQALTQHSPILFSLPESMGMSLSLYHANNPITQLKQYEQGWDAFSQSIQRQSINLAVGFVNQQQLNELLTPQVLQSYKVLLTSSLQDDNYHSALMANFAISQKITTHEDIAPTALGVLGCEAQVSRYSTGQDLTESPTRNFAVSTSGSKVMLLNKERRIEIMNNGNTKIFNAVSGQEMFTPVNPDILSQGIKHLSRFSSKGAN